MNEAIVSANYHTMLSQDQKQSLIRSGYELLRQHKGYSQAKTTEKLETLGYRVSPSSFNKIIKGNRTGAETLSVLCIGMRNLLRRELCLQTDDGQTWQPTPNCTPTEVKTAADTSAADFVLHAEGRLSLAEKVKFISTARTRVIEFGTTLNTFTEYFMTRKPSEFKLPVQRLLERGVDFDCYLLDPHWSGTLMYFNDRSRSTEGGKAGTEKISNSLRKLRIISDDYAALDLPGRFRVFTYQHFPFNYFLVVDPDECAAAHLTVSNYLYGLKRADCPVLQFSRAARLVLFLRYLKALEGLMQDARPYDWDRLSS